MKKSIFEVDVKGFRELQEGKPKWHIVRELVANALDENITECAITLSYEGRKATIMVEDDSPEGFVDLSHAYTLFATTRKRFNTKVRGRFNLGEKQTIVVCDYARILTTTGGVEFDVLKEQRTDLRKKREKGSEVTVIVKMTKEEYKECVDYCNQIIAPQNIRFTLRNKTGDDGTVTELQYKTPYKTFSAELKTEKKDKESGEMKTVSEVTDVNLHKKTDGKAFIYELGIPVCEIECDYSIDVQQKVPLSADRDKVDAKYLKTIFGEVLNVVHEELQENQSSNLWVRNGFASDRATKETRSDILTKRFGEKALIDNPFDHYAHDKAITGGYTLISNNDLSQEERDAIKSDGLVQTTSAMFGVNFVSAEKVNPDGRQKSIAIFCRKVAKEFQDISISVVFISCPESDELATFNYPQSNVLTFNVGRIRDAWWDIENGFVCVEMLDLIIHELGHKGGWHYEKGYHEQLTMLGAMLTKKALAQPEWMKLSVKETCGQE